MWLPSTGTSIRAYNVYDINTMCFAHGIWYLMRIRAYNVYDIIPYSIVLYTYFLVRYWYTLLFCKFWKSRDISSCWLRFLTSCTVSMIFLLSVLIFPFPISYCTTTVWGYSVHKMGCTSEILVPVNGDIILYSIL